MTEVSIYEFVKDKLVTLGVEKTTINRNRIPNPTIAQMFARPVTGRSLGFFQTMQQASRYASVAAPNKISTVNSGRSSGFKGEWKGWLNPVTAP